MTKDINGSVEKHISNIYALIGKLSKQVDEAKKMAEHAAKGNVESAVEIRSIKENIVRVEHSQDKIEVDIMNLETLLEESVKENGKNLVKAIAWLVGIILVLLTMHGTIILQVIAKFMK